MTKFYVAERELIIFPHCDTMALCSNNLLWLVNISWNRIFSTYKDLIYISFIWQNFSLTKKEHTQYGKTRNSLPAMPSKFFSSNQLRVKFFSKKLISRNFCEKMMAVKFRNFHTVAQFSAICFMFHCWQKFREIVNNMIKCFHEISLTRE